MNATVSTGLRPSDCRVLFGGRSAGVDLADGLPALRVALPVLAGAGEERLLADAAAPLARAGFTLFSRGSWLAGFATALPGPDIEAAAGELYRRLFSVVAGRHLYRVWNYVPGINAVTGGREAYHRFCLGRSLAFEENFGREFQRALPAASAVGSAAGPLSLGFLAGQSAPRHFENPRQVPAFEYPPEHGPRPPSFSRATVVGSEEGRRVFISGTAAIRGHASVGGRDLAGQLACTLENLALIGQATGAGPDLGASLGWQRQFKIYLRHPGDLGYVRTELDRRLLRSDDAISFLRADICRPELSVEIEATLAIGRLVRAG